MRHERTLHYQRRHLYDPQINTCIDYSTEFIKVSIKEKKSSIIIQDLKIVLIYTRTKTYNECKFLTLEKEK